MVIAKRKPLAPLYSTLANVELILDATGLRWNTDNSYGIVDAVGSCTTWKSITPGPTNRPFVAGGVFSSTGSPGKVIDGFINFGGACVYTSSSTPATWNFLSYNATATNTKSTIHIVCKIGNESNPDWVYAFLGNNRTSSANRGIHIRYEDRAGVSRSNGMSMSLTNAAAAIVSANPNDVITPDTPIVLTFETDLSQAAADRFKMYINGTQVTFSATSPSTSVTTPVGFDLVVGSGGLFVFPFHGWMSHVIIQSGIESSGTRNAFIQSLLPYTIKKADQTYHVDESRTYSAATFLNESSYYLNVSVIRNPTNQTVLAVFGNWTSAGHTYSENSYVAFRKSLDNGKTFAAKATAFDPGDDIGAIDNGAFYDDNGVVHGFANTMDGAGGTSTPGTSKLWYFTSADDGDNWSNQQITTPSDGLDFTAAYGNGYQSDGFYFFPVYRQDTGAANCAVYILRWPVGGNIATDLEWKLIYSGTTYRNEGTIGRIGTNSHILVVRDEVTNEWHQWRTTDNWDNATDDGAQTFGQTSTAPGPARITMFNITSADGGTVTPMLACYFPLRGTAELKVTYAKASDLLASGTWDTGTNTLIIDDTEMIHYGGVYQIDNTFNFLAIYTREVAASAQSTLIYFTGPTQQYALVKTELGL